MFTVKRSFGADVASRVSEGLFVVCTLLGHCCLSPLCCVDKKETKTTTNPTPTVIAHRRGRTFAWRAR